jgi:heavy metal sensor kinase
VQGVVLPPLGLTANVFVQVWDERGEMLAQSPNLPPLGRAFDPESLSATGVRLRSVRIEDARLRVLTVPVTLGAEGPVVGRLQLAASLDTVDRAREMLVFILVGGGLLAVAAASVVGWVTAGAALRPLDEATATALQITRTDDLARRIPLAGPPRDEVGRLVLAFNTTLERLEGLFETQRRFLADVSHELRTPLTAIRGNLDIVRRMGRLDDDALKSMTSEVDRMTRMVRDLLLLAQAETGQLPLARESVDLDDLMLDVYQQGKVLARDRVEVRLNVEDRACLEGDRDRLKQVLLNLVANALEHTPSGGQVTLGMDVVEDWVRLTVSDTGAGIPQEELPHLFERFYRMDRSRKRSALGGAGLGLSIAYWITRAHRGRIEVASAVGQGTTFSVWLPIKFEARAA